jgi:hypothetical protein
VAFASWHQPNPVSSVKISLEAGQTVPQAATELDLRRVVSAGAVVLLHLALISAFIFVNYARTHLPKSAQEIELTFSAANPSIAPPPLPAIQPTLISPTPPPYVAPPLLRSAPQAAPSAPSSGAIEGVGRALFGCDPAKLNLLSPEARAGCLRLHTGKPHEQSVLLGPPPDPNSPFTKEIEERFRDAQPIMRPCPQGSRNDTLGLPCFGFDQEAPPLQRH